MKRRYIIAGVSSLILLAVSVVVFLWQPWLEQGTRISFTASESGYLFLTTDQSLALRPERKDR